MSVFVCEVVEGMRKVCSIGSVGVDNRPSSGPEMVHDLLALFGAVRNALTGQALQQLVVSVGLLGTTRAATAKITLGASQDSQLSCLMR